jgi:mannosyltransferase OCH1-like enzyme
MIPKLLWQTYKSKFPPNDSISSIKTWLNLNPNYQWYYFDDVKCSQFISDHFSSEFVDMYNSLPYGVMKADAWRIAIIYVYGGVYADIDTRCLVPIDYWTKDYSFIAAVETPGGTIGNFTFAAEPNHPIIQSCLEHLLINYNDPNFMNHPHTPIQNYGAHAFHAGIKKYCESNTLDNIKIYDFHDNAFTPIPSHKTFVHHLAGSIVWSNNYDSWRKQQKNDFKIGY